MEKLKTKFLESLGSDRFWVMVMVFTVLLAGDHNLISGELVDYLAGLGTTYLGIKTFDRLGSKLANRK